MPLLLSKQIHKKAAYAVWNIQETFLELPYLSPEPFPAELHPVRQAEWIVGRILIKHLCESVNLEYHGVGRQDTGKPYLKGHDVQISISHSFPMACAMVHLEKPCGIDLELPRDKMDIVKDKFMNESEEEYRDDLNKICAVWCAKEVIYKIHGRKYLSLKEEINVNIKDDETIIGEIIRPKDQEEFLLHYEWVKDYILCFSV
ncbi:MAG: 4'-phosphopantetheinyl transferase superfamily protein [Cytophagales bacterium]|nr:4'-phosphopantetheinyl transferase superfamily protein [Cytophagales bacterium]